MGQRGEWNVGELVRREEKERAFLLGFTTYSGRVTAASDWGEPAERKIVRPALNESYEALFHETEIPNFLLDLRNKGPLQIAMREPRLERAIGVIYSPETERMSHYFSTSLADQFDAVIHLDHTRALEPLERTTEWSKGEFPETYPSAV